MTFEFEGIPSGDHECFCFAVDRETFIRIEEREPERPEENHFNHGMFNLYPNALFGDKRRMRIKIEIEPA